jgi:hypothetical protein
VRLGDRLSARVGVLTAVAFVGALIAVDRLVAHVAPSARWVVFLLGAVVAYVLTREVWRPILERLSTKEERPDR